jgi:hypothetical protein
VEGSLCSEGEHRRVTAALVRTRDQSSVWTASFDSEPTSVLEFQRELANAIAQQVRLHIDPLRLGHQLTPLSTRRALEHFALATPIDPDYALAWSGIANAYGGMQMTGDAPPREVSPHATEASERALRAQPDLAEVQTSLGFRKVTVGLRRRSCFCAGAR